MIELSLMVLLGQATSPSLPALTPAQADLAQAVSPPQNTPGPDSGRELTGPSERADSLSFAVIS
ncbi:MAG: hypothetical protein ICV62_14210, partial [Cyanobacteria bacterium Co-bin13]|nr:hypothetical protein [Cyanobacteria bacterium Co-bin13]